MRLGLLGGRAPVRASLAVIAAGVLLSCTDATAPRVGPPVRLDIVAGNAQQGTVAQELAQPLVVKVVDEAGNGVSGQIVNFVVTSGGGHPFAGASITNADGIAQERWTLGTSTSEAQRLEVRAVDNETGEGIVYATFTAVPTADEPVSAFRVGDRQTGVFEVELNPVGVILFDRYRNRVPGATVHWTILHGGGSVSPASSVTDDTAFAGTRWTIGDSTQVPYMLEARFGSHADTLFATGVKSEVATVEITPASGSVEVGGTFDFSYGAKTANGLYTPGRVHRWWSDDTTIARVDDGRVTGVRPGVTRINVSVDGKVAAAQLSVTGGGVAWVSVTPCCWSYPRVGDRIQYTAQALDASFKPIPGKTATWTSSAPSLVSVDENGLATVLARTPSSPVTITATIDGVQQPVKIWVE